MSDPIDKPFHYNRGKIQVWDFIIDQGLNYLLGNVCKYICRAGYKGSRLEDLKKARAYLDREIKREEENPTFFLNSLSEPVPSTEHPPFIDPNKTYIISRK